MRPMNFGPGSGKELADRTQNKPRRLDVSDDEIMMLASKAHTSPVDPAWIQGHVKVTSLHERALKFGRAVLEAAENKLNRKG